MRWSAAPTIRTSISSQTTTLCAASIYQCLKYVSGVHSHTQELGEFSCCSFVGGIIRGVMVAAGYPCTVTAYDMKEEGSDGYSVYLIRLEV